MKVESTKAEIKNVSPNIANAMLADAVFKPILFSTEMVKALLNGSKTITRRLIKGVENATRYAGHWQPELDGVEVYDFDTSFCKPQISVKPKYQLGNILWVRETWQQHCIETETDENTWAAKGFEATGQYVYRADNYELPKDSIAFGKWKPSLFMPRLACRLFLEVTKIKVERLHDISAEDIKAEGIRHTIDYYPILLEEWERLWVKINGQKSWDENPFVWVYTFKVVECPHGFR